MSKKQAFISSASTSGVCQKIKPAVVSICLPSANPDGSLILNISGTGFNVDPDGLVVTCRHVVEPYVQAENPNILQEIKESKNPVKTNVLRPSVMFYFKIDEDHWAAIQKAVLNIQIDSKEDIALLSLIPGDFRPGYQKNYPFISFDSDRILEGQEIVTVGFPLGDSLHKEFGGATYSFHFGHIGAVAPFPSKTVPPDKLQLDILTNHGNSGGPVIKLSNGRVVGMLNLGAVIKHGEQAQIEVPTGISYAVPAWKIIENIDSNKEDGKKIFPVLSEMANS